MALSLPMLYSEMVQNVVQAQCGESGDSIPRNRKINFAKVRDC